ncbi:hypothetical protein AB6F81_11675, partial [Proteus mirabilis]
RVLYPRPEGRGFTVLWIKRIDKNQIISFIKGILATLLQWYDRQNSHPYLLRKRQNYLIETLS